MATQEPILLLQLGAKKEIRCTEYDCAATVVLEKLKPAIEIAWNKIGESARSILQEHWKDGLWITLVWGSYEWAKPSFGYATTEPKGHSMFCWSDVLRDIPQSVLVTTVAHEFGHAAFIAIGEPAHAEKKKT